MTQLEQALHILHRAIDEIKEQEIEPMTLIQGLALCSAAVVGAAPRNILAQVRNSFMTAFAAQYSNELVRHRDGRFEQAKREME